MSNFHLVYHGVWSQLWITKKTLNSRLQHNLLKSVHLTKLVKRISKNAFAPFGRRTRFCRNDSEKDKKRATASSHTPTPLTHFFRIFHPAYRRLPTLMLTLSSRLQRTSGNQHIARPPNRNDSLRIGRVSLDLYTQITDVYRDRSRILQTLRSPSILKQRIDTDYKIHVLCHIGQ